MCFMSSSKCFSCFTFIAPSLSAFISKSFPFTVIPLGHSHFNTSALRIFPNVTTNEDKYVFRHCLLCSVKWFVLLNLQNEHSFNLGPSSSLLIYITCTFGASQRPAPLSYCSYFRQALVHGMKQIVSFLRNSNNKYHFVDL